VTGRRASFHQCLRQMNNDNIAVFFYGLFMDESLLASKGVRPSHSARAYLEGYRLRIGKRATLVPERGGKAHGVLMTIGRDDAAALYSEQSVSDYVAEAVTVMLPDGSIKQATCYNLPADRLEGTNPAYAESLLRLATSLGFPEEYLDTIRTEARPNPASKP